jgi:hypothetical protein
VSERPDVVAFAEKVLELLEEGRYTATYKYAVLLALMDLCLERADRSGLPPSTVTTRELARRVVELYWPHTEPYPGPISAGCRSPWNEMKRRIQAT